MAVVAAAADRLTALIGTGEVFLIFAVVCLFALWFVGRYAPETRDRNFSEIDAELRARARGGEADSAMGQA